MSLLNDALAKARAGDYVFPCKPDKTPYTEHGLNDATGDEKIIVEWWTKWPDALIGVNMGKSRRVGLDFDGEEGLKSYNRMILEYPELANTKTVKTPSGGLHVEVLTGKMVILSANRAFNKIGYPNVDIKSTGGYLVDEPSISPNGAYVLTKDLPFVELSESLIKLFESRGLVVNDRHFVNTAIDRILIPQSKLKEDYFPPCMKRILNDLRESINLEHTERQFIVSYLYSIGYNPENIKGFFKSSPDYKERVTGYQVDHIIKKPYRCPTCDTMSKWGYCIKNNQCNASKTPVWYYRYNFYCKNWLYNNSDDTGIAQMLADFYGDDILYVRKPGLWFVWNGAYWPQDIGEAKLCQIVISLADVVNDRAKFLTSLYHDQDGVKLKKDHEKHIKSLWSQYKYIRSKNGMSSIIITASKVVEKVALKNLDDLDKEPYLINLANGVFNLDTSEFIPHGERTKPFYMTMRANISYNPSAKCPLFNKFLNEITLNRADLIDYLQRSLGYSLSGYTKEEKAFVWLGPGRNGKTVLAEIIYNIEGDYASSASSSAFTIGKNYNTRSFSFARLRGKRFIKCSEVIEGSMWNVERFKQFIGGDTITAEEKNKPEFDYRPVGKPFFLFNHMPSMPKDRSTETKLFVVPFDFNIVKEQEDHDLEEKLKAEYEGIFLWLLGGYRKWKANDLRNVPDSVQNATNEFWRDVDWFASFLHDRCIVNKQGMAESDELYNEYKAWHSTNNERIISAYSQNAFGRRLTAAGFTKYLKTECDNGIRKGVWYRVGLVIKPNESSGEL